MLADALEHLVRGIVDDPDAVEVNHRRSHRGNKIEIWVAPDDRGRVIGRGGHTADALRTVIGAISEDGPVRVDVLDGNRR